MKINVIISRPYSEVRNICHGIKNSDLNSLKKAAFWLAVLIPDKSILIPVPGHDSRQTYMRLIGTAAVFEAEKLGKDIRVLFALDGKEHPSLCELKEKGLPVDGVDLGIRWSTPEKDYRQCLEKNIAEGYRPVLIDNVIDTGKTIKACLDVIGDADVAVLGNTGRWTRECISKGDVINYRANSVKVKKILDDGLLIRDPYGVEQVIDWEDVAQYNQTF
jgi:hypothetical protein